MANVVPIRRKPAKRPPRPSLVHQFLVILSGTKPLVWRRIQVPEKHAFWDLHVAIQHAMGWLDYHLHEFRLLDAKQQQVVSIGLPTDDDPLDHPEHEEHEATLRWAAGSFDPEAFDPAAVKFDNPRKRWRKAFGR